MPRPRLPQRQHPDRSAGARETGRGEPGHRPDRRYPIGADHRRRHRHQHQRPAGDPRRHGSEDRQSRRRHLQPAVHLVARRGNRFSPADHGRAAGWRDPRQHRRDVRNLLQSISDGFHDIPLGTVGDDLGTISTPWGSSASLVLAKTTKLHTWSDTPVSVTLDTTTPAELRPTARSSARSRGPRGRRRRRPR